MALNRRPRDSHGVSSYRLADIYNNLDVIPQNGVKLLRAQLVEVF